MTDDNRCPLCWGRLRPLKGVPDYEICDDCWTSYHLKTTTHPTIKELDPCGRTSGTS